MTTPSGAVEALLSYLAPTGRTPRYYLYRPSGEAPPTPAREQRPVSIHDARRRAPPPGLEREGVALVRQHSRVVDFYDPEEVRAVYFGEVEALVRKHTGASRVHVFDHNVRCAPRAQRGEGEVSRPVRFVHNDYTVRSGPQRVRDLLPGEAEDLLRRRFAVINVWRPIRGPVQEMPLAVCDATSMRLEDFVESDLVYPDRVGEIYSVRYRPEHRWLYFPRMEREEVMLLKCYDSMIDGRARFTAHSAFNDPGSPPDAPPRESIEIRTLAFFAA